MSNITIPDGYEVIHTYKNGNIKVAHREPCMKCNGKGQISYYAHIFAGVCYDCGGSGVVTIKELMKTPENEAKDRAKAEAKAAKLAAERERKEQERRDEDARREAELAEKRAISQHVGAVGDKIQITAILVYTARWEQPSFSGYGTVAQHRHIFKDDAGNVYTWKTTNSVYTTQGDNDYMVASQGDRVTLKGVIKAHSEYQGEKQTELTRCKAVDIQKVDEG